ncbi:MAG: biotin transporter BioY [Spirochaetes bacterium]|nr:biotin transporter BioY [Spirochaetota bacterium]
MHPILFSSGLRTAPNVRHKTLLLVKGVLFSLLFALFTGLMSKARFFLPFTPVPVTGQVFAVLLGGLLLGRVFGPLSQAFYVGLGLLGFEWFSLFPLVPTGGYLLGFIAAPYAVSLIMERKTATTGFLHTMTALSAGVFVIYLFGFAFFTAATHTGPIVSFRLTVLPFIPFDLAKAVCAALIICPLKKKYGPKTLI